MARSMVVEWGMSEQLGLVAYTDDNESMRFLGGGRENKGYSEATAQAIDEEVKRLVEEGHQRARGLIEEHRDELEHMAEMLMKFETLNRDDIEKIVNGTFNEDEKQKKLLKIEAPPLKEGAQPEPTDPQEEPIGFEPKESGA